MDQPTDAPRKSRLIKLAPIIVVALIAVVAVYVISRPTPGRRTTRETSVEVYVGNSSGSAQAQYPIRLQEGGDPSHEADHVIEPLLGMQGVSTAVFDWTSGLVLTVKFDPEKVSAQQIADAVSASGYLEGAQQQQ